MGKGLAVALGLAVLFVGVVILSMIDKKVGFVVTGIGAWMTITAL